MAVRHWAAASGNWTTAADWSGGVVPGSTDDAVIDAARSYTVAENASSTAPIKVHSIAIGAGAVLGITDVAGNQVGLGGVANHGALDVDTGTGNGGGGLTIAGTLDNTGSVQIGPNDATLSAATAVTLGGLDNAGGASLQVYGSASHAATLTVAGPAANSGAVDINGGVLTVDTTKFTNIGILSAADAGRLDFSAGGLTNLSGTTLAGGIYVVAAGSTWQLPNNTTIVTLAANLTLSGVGSVVQSLDTVTRSPVAIESMLTTIATNGALQLLDDRNYTTTNAIADSGSLTVGAGTFTAASMTVAAGGAVVVDAGATLSLGSPLKVAGTVTNAGTITGTKATAVKMASGAGRLILDPGATFGSSVAGGGKGSVLELAKGSGSATLNTLGANFTNFGTVTVDAGATWTIDALAPALTGATITGSGGSSTLTLKSSGTVNLSGVGKFGAINLAAGSNTVAVADKTLSGGALAIRDGAGGKNIISAAGDTKASTGKTLIYIAGSGSDMFAGGFENDLVKVTAAAVRGDALTGGRGANTLRLTTAGMVNLAGVGKFGTINLAAGNNTVTVADKTLSGGSVTIVDGASGRNVISAAGDTKASAGKTLIYAAAADKFTGGFENDLVKVSAAAVRGDTLTGGRGTNMLDLTTAGMVNLAGVGKFGTIYLAAGNNTVTVSDQTLSGGPVTIIDGPGGKNSVSAAGDTKTSTGKTLTYMAGAGTDKFTGGFENDLVQVGAAAMRGDTMIGGRGTNTLTLTSAGPVNLSGVGKFGTIDLAAGNNTVTVTDKTLSGGPVTIIDGPAGKNSVTAAGDTKASAGKTLTYLAGAGADSFTGGFENDVVKVGAAAVHGGTLTGGRGTNTLDLTTAGIVNLSGVSKFGTINLAAGNNTVMVADKTLSGGSLTLSGGISGNNHISASGDTATSTGKTLTYVAGAAAGADSFIGGVENDAVKVGAAAVGGDTLTGGSGTDALTLTSAGTVNLSGISKFGTINLAAGNNTVTVADTTLSGGSVTIKAGISGNNIISAAGDTPASTGRILTYVAGAGIDSFTGGFEDDVVQVSAAVVGRDFLTGGSRTNKLTLTTAGTFSLSGVSKFGAINLAAGENTVTVTDKTLSGGSVTIKDGAFKDGTGGNNSISAAGDTVESVAKTLTYVAGTGTDSFTGGWEIDVVKVSAETVGGDTLTGSIFGAATLDLTTADTFSLSGVSKFGTINLAEGDNTVTLTDQTLSGGSVTIKDGASGDNSLSAAGDTKASTGKTLTYLAGTGADSFAGGFENDAVKVGAAAVGGDTLTGGSGTNTLTLTTAGTFSLSGVSKFGAINLAAGNNTVTMADKTLSGGSVTIKAGATGKNSISAAGDTTASTGKTLTYLAGTGAEKFTGGFENDIVHAGAGADVLTGGAGNDVFYAGGDTTMTGAGGANEFVFSAAGNNTITDFAASPTTPAPAVPTLTTLVTFNGTTNGENPTGGLIVDAAGDLFGTTQGIGDFINEAGTVFEIAKTAGSYASTPTTLVSFNVTDGSQPGGRLIADAAGDLFGTTFSGGANKNGTVFEIAKTAGSYASTPTTLVSFNGTDGGLPAGGLIADAAGDLFGTTSGGANSAGTVFEIAKTAGSYASTPTTLVSFNGTNGAAPEGGLIADAAGDLFGTTAAGGANKGGTVFEIAKTAGSYASTPTTLVSFNGTNGASPYAGVIADAAGDLFGTAAFGGANGDGTVFELVNNGSGSYTFTTLVSFDGTNGNNPTGGLIVDGAGDLFGTTDVGGANKDGTVFEIPFIDGSYAGTPTTLASFNGTTNGEAPYAGVIADAAGDLFGTTEYGDGAYGTAFELTGTGFVVPPTTTNEIVFSNKGFALGLSGASTTPQPLPTGLFVSDSTGTFTKTSQRFAYGTTNGDLFYSASGTTATEHLVTALTGDPALTASHLFFIT